jgi:tetratricopeptide (TPR) repeat protein
MPKMQLWKQTVRHFLCAMVLYVFLAIVMTIFLAGIQILGYAHWLLPVIVYCSVFLVAAWAIHRLRSQLQSSGVEQRLPLGIAAFIRGMAHAAGIAPVIVVVELLVALVCAATLFGVIFGLACRSLDSHCGITFAGVASGLWPWIWFGLHRIIEAISFEQATRLGVRSDLLPESGSAQTLVMGYGWFVALALVWSVHNVIRGIAQFLHEGPEGNAQNHLDWGRSKMMVRDHKEALRHFSEAIRIGCDYEHNVVHCYTERGIANRKLGCRSRAIADFEKAVEIDASCEKACLEIAAIRLEEGDREEAIREYSRAIEGHDLNPQIRLARARLHVQQSQLTAALEDYGAVLADWNQTVRRSRLEYEALAADAVSVHLLRAEILLKSGDAGAAIEECGEGLLLAPESAGCYRLRAESHRVLGNADAFQADHNKAEALVTEAAVHLAEAQRWFAERQLYRQIIACTQAIWCNPECVAAHRLLAEGYASSGYEKEAICTLNRLLVLLPDDPPALCRRAQLHGRSRDYAAAYADYEEAIRIDLACIDAYLNRGELYLLLDQPLAAFPDYTKAGELDPTSAWAISGAAECQRRMANYAQAIQGFSHALEICPDYGPALASRGAAFKALGDIARATADLDAALRLDPHNAFARQHRSELPSDP